MSNEDGNSYKNPTTPAQIGAANTVKTNTTYGTTGKPTLTSPDLSFNYDDDLSPTNSTHTDIEPILLPTSTTPPQQITWSTTLFCLCAALNSCNLGYDIGVCTVAGPLLQNGKALSLSDVQLEIMIGSLNLFAMVGAIAAPAISDRFGRRWSFIFAAVGFVLGVGIMATAGSFGVLMGGRLFVGLGVGFGLAIDPLYISEISPAGERGRLVTWSEIATNVGIVLGFSMGFFFMGVDDDVAWRAMLGVGVVMPTCLIFAVVFVMPESPRWLISRGRVDEGRAVLGRVYPPPYNVDIVIKDIQDNIRREEQLEHASGWSMIMFPTPAVKRMLLVGLGAAITQQMVGIEAIQYFLLTVLEEAGIADDTSKYTILIALGFIKLVAIVVTGRLFDSKGRRPMFIISLSVMMASLLLIAICFSSNQNNTTAIFTIFGVALYVTSFSLAIGPGAWLIPSEIFALGIRAKAMSIATFLNRATGTVISSTFLSITDAIGFGPYFLLLTCFCGAALVFFDKLLPETKGKTLEEMSLYFAEITDDAEFLEAERRIQGSETQNDEGVMT